MKVDADGFSFDFTTALDAFAFDEKDKSKPTFHGQRMKAVDIVAEQRIDKPIYYICLLTFDNALNTFMQKELTKELPVGLASRRWKQEIVKNCQVVNIVTWNKNFPKWPVTHTPATG
ncbi:MAG: hypothetical protein ABIJ31_13985 [Pseudomonadota bacterium]